MEKFKERLKLYPSNIWFIALTILIPSLYGLFNRYFIGYMSMEAILVDQSYEALEVLMEVFLEMIPLVVIAVASQNYTKKEEVRRIVRNSAAFQLLITSIFTIIFILGARYFIDFINTMEVNKNTALTYFRLKSLILPIQSLWMIFAIGIKSINPKKAVRLTLANVFINYILDALLISNFSFSLKLGLVGAALSGIFANVITLLIAFLIFKREVGLGEKFFSDKLDKVSLRKIVNIGKYTGLESFVRNVGYILGVVLVMNLITSQISIASYNTINNIFWTIVLVPTLALTEGTKFAIGNAVAEKNKDKIKDIIKTTTVILLSWMLISLILGQALVPKISEWLNNIVFSKEMLTESMYTYNVLWVAYLAFVLSSIFNSYFYGLGAPKPILMVSIFVNIIIYIPLGLLCKYNYINLSYANILLSTVLIYWVNSFLTYGFYRRSFKKLVLI